MVNIQEHTTPEKMERYSFLWSEVRLVIAAVALFLGGIPPLAYVPLPAGLMSSVLGLSWIISGLAAAYLLYRWWPTKTVFGGKNNRDVFAFFVMVVSGINLGLAGILARNIGMSLSSNKAVLVAVGILYLAAAYHLHKRWRENGEKIF